MHSYFGTDLPMWTILFFLSLTLAGFVYLVDHYSKGRRRKANSLLYVHPSNALIEQALPMVNLNPKIFAELNKYVNFYNSEYYELAYYIAYRVIKLIKLNCRKCLSSSLDLWTCQLITNANRLANIGSSV